MAEKSVKGGHHHHSCKTERRSHTEKAGSNDDVRGIVGIGGKVGGRGS